jgi:hypothetical protein
MNFAKGGQNIVQAGNNNPNVFQGAGNILGAILGQKLWTQKQDYMHNQRKELETHKTNESLRGDITRGLMAGPMWGQMHDYVNQTYGEDHPDVLSGKKKPTDYLRPDLQRHVANNGIVTSKLGPMPGAPSKGVAYAEALKDNRGDENTKETSKQGRFANFKDTQAAYNAGHITAEEAAETNPKFNDNYDTYKSENPGYQGSSEAKINEVHSKLDSMGN